VIPDDPDHRRELLLVDIIDNCPLCTANFPVVCSIHRLQAQRLAIQRRDAAGALS
jgi:hypothetical protein